nr:hypothetical protein Iba_chr05aCG6160 [Ipomoea batatas]
MSGDEHEVSAWKYKASRKLETRLSGGITRKGAAKFCRMLTLGHGIWGQAVGPFWILLAVHGLWKVSMNAPDPQGRKCLLSRKFCRIGLQICLPASSSSATRIRNRDRVDIRGSRDGKTVSGTTTYCSLPSSLPPHMQPASERGRILFWVNTES